MKKDLEEDYTREIEIENAYNTFEQAIGLQKSKNFTDAYEKYKELLKKEVIYTHYYEEPDMIRGLQNGGLNTHPDELGLLSQNVKTIRFLFFRNRAFLYFEMFKAGQSVLHDVFLRDQQLSESGAITYDQFLEEIFYCMIEDLSNCFIYQEPDESHLRLIHDIFSYLKLTRLAKFTLEYSLTYAKESDGAVGLLPLDEWAQNVWEDCKERGFQADSKLKEKLRFLEPMKEGFERLVERKYSKNELNVPVKALSCWLDVIQAFNQAVKQNQDKERQQELAKNNNLIRTLDPYLATEQSLDKVMFSFPSPEEIVEPSPEVQEQPQLEQPIKSEEPSNPEEPRKEGQVFNGDAKRPEETAQEDAMAVEEEQLAPPMQPQNSNERVVQRSSRRLNPGDSVVTFELDDVQLTRHHYFETEAFFEYMDGLFRQTFDTQDRIMDDVVGHIIDSDQESKSPIYFKDFLKVLNEWKPKIHTALLLSERQSGPNNDSKSDADKIKLLHVLTYFGNQNESSSDAIVELLDDRENSEYIKEFLSKIPTNLHAKQVKIGILHHLVGGEDPLLLSSLWGLPLFNGVRDWVLQVEADIFKSWSLSSHASHPEATQNIYLSIGIFEILTDYYASLKSQVDTWLVSDSKGSLSKSMKSNLNNSLLELLRLDQRLKKWSNFFKGDILESFKQSHPQQHLRVYARYLWASNYFLASQSFNWKEKKLVVVHLEELERLLQDAHEETILIKYPNFDSIGNLNMDAVRRRLTTASILSIFSKILWSNSSKVGGSGDTITLLENILIHKDHDSNGNIPSENPQAENSLISSVIHGRANLDKSSLLSVREFLDQCPIDLKLSLWSILFLYYREREMFEDFQRGFEQNLKFMLTFLNSDKYQETKGNRVLALLNSLNFFGSHLRTFLSYLGQNNWKLPVNDRKNSLETLKNVSKMFELFYTFSLHEEAALITGAKISVELKSTQAFQRLKDFCIECVTVMLVYATNQVQQNGGDEQLTKDLLISVHSQLGLRRLCDSSNGIFLKFAEDNLVGLNDRPAREISQLLSCRFHYKVKIKDHFPADHGTQSSADLDESSANELARFILPLCFSRNPLLKVPRLDMKQVVDDIFEVVKELDLDADKQLVQNNARLENFFQNTSIDARFIKRCFYGLVDLGIQRPTKQYEIANEGLYFLEAIFMFNNYKIRKKSAQSRTVELEKIIKLLQDDLITGTERVESWILLGQAYGYIVEDDLIWTSDKLNIIERKVITANIQRKSLISYLVAINLLTHKGLTEAEHYRPVISVLMNSLVKEFYAACRSPLDMIAFKVQNNGKFVKKKTGSMVETVSDKPTVTVKFLLKLMQQCLHLAVKSNSNEWTSFYYLAKIQAKLGTEPDTVLKTMLKASALSTVQGIPSDPLLESAYKICTWVYKYVKNDKLSVKAGYEYLIKDPTLKIKDQEAPESKKDLYNIVVLCLKKLATMDKKGWYHKPSYRQAMIVHDEFDDFETAKKIMSKFFTLRSNNKTFIQMWKPEHERPGKHFVYMYQYTQLYIKLLRRELDLSSLVMLLPKLRRANSTMVMLYFAWENICSSICKIIRIIAGIEDGFTESFILYKPHATFVKQAKTVVEQLKNTGVNTETKPYLSYLHVINDMRKLNNGFGPTSLIDDTFSSIFLKLFLYEVDIMKLPEEIIDEPNAKTKKLARRDVFPFITELVNRIKRDIDSVLKDSPFLFNEFVEKYIEEKKKEYTKAYSLQHLRPSVAPEPVSGLLPGAVIQQNSSLGHKDPIAIRNETPQNAPDTNSTSLLNTPQFAPSVTTAPSLMTLSPAKLQLRGAQKKGPLDIEIETTFSLKTQPQMDEAQINNDHRISSNSIDEQKSHANGTERKEGHANDLETGSDKNRTSSSNEDHSKIQQGPTEQSSGEDVEEHEKSARDQDRAGSEPNLELPQANEGPQPREQTNNSDQNNGTEEKAVNQDLVAEADTTTINAKAENSNLTDGQPAAPEDVNESIDEKTSGTPEPSVPEKRSSGEDSSDSKKQKV